MRLPPSQVDGILGGSRVEDLGGKVGDELAGAGIPAVRVKDNPGADVDGVRLATMHAMKGLEFRCVAVVGVTATAVPFAKEVTPVDVDRTQHDSDLLRERCLLFVAATRACEALHVSWKGPRGRGRPWPSPARSARSGEQVVLGCPRISGFLGWCDKPGR